MPAPDQLARQMPTTISTGTFDPALPYFAYGSLKKDGLAYPKIEPYVAEVRPFGVTGILCVRDGLPTLVNEWRDGRGCRRRTSPRHAASDGRAATGGASGTCGRCGRAPPHWCTAQAPPPPTSSRKATCQ